VIAYSVAQRTQEIGIRIALGASRTIVLTSVLKEAVVIGVVGLALGMAAALALTRFLSGLLFGVGARDPTTFVALPLGLLLVAVLAALIPVRAVRVNPVVALRGQVTDADRRPALTCRSMRAYSLHVKMVQIRNVPDALHRKLKVRAADLGQHCPTLMAELEAPGGAVRGSRCWRGCTTVSE
jgi:predicted lysophospholipase L1 biosynthesis ABC-type transport system permease subunit